jgi:hypothetical protein
MYVGAPSSWEVKRLSITEDGDEVVEDWSPVYAPQAWDLFVTPLLT